MEEEGVMAEGNAKDKLNFCPFNSHWGIDENDLLKALDTVSESHNVLSVLMDHTKHLPAIAANTEELKTCLMAAATGRDHIPVSVVEKILRIAGWVIFGLIGVIVFLLTGAHLGWLPNLH